MAKIYTYSIIHSAAEAFADKVPYVVAVVEEQGKRFSTRVEGYTESMKVEINQEVKYLKDDEYGNKIYTF